MPPVEAGSVLIVPLLTGGIAAYHVADGSPAWTIELTPHQAIAADADRVYVPCADAIHAVDAATGSVVWRTTVNAPTAPLLVRSGWVIVAAERSLIALRATDGRELWRRDVGSIEVRPAIDGDVLYVSLADGVGAFDLQSGASRWMRRLGGKPGEPLAIGGRVYVGAADKYFYSLDATSGRVDWPMRTGAEPRGRAAADDDHVYFVSMDNLLRAVDRGHGALRWKQGLPFRPAAGPVVLGGSVTVAGPASSLPVFSAHDGRPLERVELGGKLAALPALLQLPEGKPAIAAVTGSLEDQWKLTLLEPGVEAPVIPIAPLTELPGLAIPLGWPAG
jgi:outer membrane protein assembly factor BamB